MKVYNQMDIKEIQITDISSGDNYYIFVTNLGKIYDWGLNLQPFKFGDIILDNPFLVPMELEMDKKIGNSFLFLHTFLKI